MKEVLSAVAVLMTFGGYIPYYWDMYRGKTKPHVYSWFLWSFITFIVFGIQITNNGGAASWVTLSAAIAASVVLMFAVIDKSKKDITRSDTVFLIMAFITLGVWLIAKDPILSAILATLTEVLGFAPTIRKSWKSPYTETLVFYVINTVRFVLAVLAVEQYNIASTLYPASWLVINGFFAGMLLLRRKQLSIAGLSSDQAL